MKSNLRSACLFFLVFLFFTVGFVGLVSAADYNFTHFNESNYNSRWGDLSSPTSKYDIWGYTGRTYYFSTNFTENYTMPLESTNNTTMVFYWNCHGKKSDPSDYNTTSDLKSWNCSHKWDDPGTYYASVGIFQNERPVNVSYWVPIHIINETNITVQNLSMLDEKKGFEGNYSTHLYRNNTTYCGYEDNDYSFSVKFNATSRSNADDRTIGETTTVVYWDYGSSENASGNSILGNISDKKVISDNNVSNISTGNTKYIYWNKNFTHEWDDPGKKNISAIFFHWDPLDGSEMYSDYNKSSEYKNMSILIIRDPKNFVSYPIIGAFSNLHNWGILLSILGLIIFYFTYTRNNIPIKISIFGLKPFYLKSVNSFTGTLIFVAGMYLYFVFGRCPWDIPILSSLPELSDMYFNMLYREYETKQHFGIPYLSIMLGIIYVFILSLIIHLIAIPFYKGEFKIGEFLRRKITSTSAQPEMISYAVENKTNREN